MRDNRRAWIGVLLIIVGTLVLFDKSSMLDISGLVSRYWPLVLIGVGAWIILGRGERRWSPPTGPPATTGTRSFSNDVARISESTMFGNVYAQVRSREFSGGDVSTVFGTCTVDLSGAALAVGDNALNLDAVFGKLTIILPANVEFSASADAVAGSVNLNGQKRDGIFPSTEWTSPGYTTSLSRLRLDLSVVFGEISLIRVG